MAEGTSTREEERRDDDIHFGHPALPTPDTTRLVPAARRALGDTQNPINQRDRYELENLIHIHDSLNSRAELEYWIGRRLQLLLTARVHGWVFARKVVAYEEATEAGIYASRSCKDRVRIGCPRTCGVACS